jgi:PadR family transcriptional regulator, regulatory protein PadR
MKLNDYEHKLLAGWEDVHKKGQLSLWILLSLQEGAKHMADIKAFIYRLTDDAISADDKSLYRALRRFEDADILGFTNQPSQAGPDLKVYHLTETGKRVVRAFIAKHIALFYKPAVRNLINEAS